VKSIMLRPSWSDYIFSGMNRTYDVIVIGTGGVGSAALYHLAKRGVTALGLDRFPPGHDRGSSHGKTRVIRQAYFEHPDYVPLLLRAYELWEELSQRAGKRLYHEIGLLQLGLPEGQVVRGVLEAARLHNLQVDQLTGKEAATLFPAFSIHPSWQAVFERRAGYLDVQDCVVAHADQAQKLGAELRTGVTVLQWKCENDEVVVETDAGQCFSKRLVIAGGAWNASLLADLGIPLEVRRKFVAWYPITNDMLRADRGCPAFLYETAIGVFYGIPAIDELGVKFARHDGGEPVLDPLTVNRAVSKEEAWELGLFARTFLPYADYRVPLHSVCMYTMSPDENFIVDLHPDHPNIAFAAGLSGHGFKFTSVLGEALADLALERKTGLPIGFLNCRRFTEMP
jgi:sarcosine oxidase